MFCRAYIWAFLLAATAGAAEVKPLPMANVSRDRPVDFQSEVLPILKNNCLACHGESKPKGGLVLETPQAILKGGDSGPAVVPGKSAESLLLKAAGHQDPDMVMPPRENKVNAGPLKPEELGLLKLWIDQGATGQVSSVSAIDWQPLPDSVNPIYATAVTPDGQFAACGRANEIFIYHLPARRLITRLVDQQLGDAAHHDLVHSLAFSPDGQSLASGGYREVKLWRQAARAKKAELAATNAVETLEGSSNGKWLIGAGSNGVLVCWELATGKTAGSAMHTGVVKVLSCSTDGSRVVSAGPDALRVWTIPGLKEITAMTMTNGVSSAAWLGDGRLAVAEGGGRAIRIYALNTNGVLNLRRELPQERVTCLAGFASNKAHLASGSADGLVRIWDVDKGEVVRQLSNGAPVKAIAVRRDDKRIACGGANGTRLWDAGDGKLIAEMKGDRYSREAVSSAERDLAFAKGDVAYQKTSVEGAEKQLKTASERLTKATEAFGAAEKAFGEKQTAMKTANEGKTVAEKTLADLNAELKSVTEKFEAADKMAKQAAADAKAAIEKATQAKLSADQAAQTKTDTEKIAADAAALAAKTKSSSNGVAEAAKAVAEKMAAEAAGVAEKAKAFAESVAADASAKVKLALEAKATAEKAVDEVAAKSFALGQLKAPYDKVKAESPDKIKQATEKVTASLKAIESADKELKKAEQTKSIADQELQLAKAAATQGTNGLETAKANLKIGEQHQQKTEAALERAKKRVTESEKAIVSLAFSPDNVTLGSLDEAGKIHTWSAESGEAFDSYAGRAVAFGPSPDVVQSEGGVTTSAASPCLATLETNGHVVVWELNPAWTLERTIGTGTGDSPLVDRVNAVRFSPDSSLLATGGGEPSRSGEIKIWKAADGSLVKSFGEIHSDSVLALDFSPDGKHIASGAADRFVRVVNLESGKLVKSFEGHTHHVLGVSWKRDGRTLASSGADNILKVWDFVSGERKKNIEGFSKEVTSVTFVGMDQALASSGDTQVRLVKENGENVRTFAGPSDFVYSAAATPDGRIVVAGGQDSTLRVWDGSDGKALMTFAPR